MEDGSESQSKTGPGRFATVGTGPAGASNCTMWVLGRRAHPDRCAGGDVISGSSIPRCSFRASEHLTEDQGGVLLVCRHDGAGCGHKGPRPMVGRRRRLPRDPAERFEPPPCRHVAKQRRRLHRFWTSRAWPPRATGSLRRRNHASIARSVAASTHEATRRLVHDHIDHHGGQPDRQLDVARPFISTNSSALDHV